MQRLLRYITTLHRPNVAGNSVLSNNVSACMAMHHNMLAILIFCSALLALQWKADIFCSVLLASQWNADTAMSAILAALNGMYA